jgi:hypothetical protein
METLLPEFQKECEQQANQEKRSVVIAMDETFFGQFMILVMMDLCSGYLLLEDIADDRCYETWFSKTEPHLKSLGINVTHAISDRARALIKLAVTGFNVESGADLFHAQQDISRYLGSKLGSKVKKAEVRLTDANKAIKEATDKKEKIKLDEQCGSAQKDFDDAKQVQATYHECLQGIGDEVHPFALKDSQANDATRIADGLEKQAQAVEQVAQQCVIEDKKKVMQKFRNQIPALAVSVTCWWTWVASMLGALPGEENEKAWVKTYLLPVAYWHYQVTRTQSPRNKKKYHEAWENALNKLNTAPFTATLTDREKLDWLMRADMMVRQFHRSSSAVEGRNGCLSQLYHTGRGFTPARLKALTVIWNYGIKRDDGTTAAQRLFEMDFEDPFIWLMKKMGSLPLARNGTCKRKPNSLLIQNVPA